MFVNYVTNKTRNHPLNLAVARILLGVYAFWHAASMDIAGLIEWPVSLTGFYSEMLYPPAGYENILLVEQAFLLIAALALIVGYRIRMSAFCTAFFLSHLAGVIRLVNPSGETDQLLVGGLLIVVYGLYSSQDVLSVDGIRRTRNHSVSELNSFLKGDLDDAYELSALKWMLLLLGILYFGAAYAKFDTPLLDWVTAENLARWITYYQYVFQTQPPLSDIILSSSLLRTVSMWGAILSEMSLLVAILLGVSVTLPILALIGMHIGIAAGMGIQFIDMLFFLALFGAYDRAYVWMVSDRSLDLVYDEQCYFCARSLYLFKLLDINQTVSFYSQSDAPEEYHSRDDVEFNDEMYIFDEDGVAYGGYYAFRELLRQFGVTKPLAWLMAVPYVAVVGELVYAYIASNRSQYFVCTYDSSRD